MDLLNRSYLLNKAARRKEYIKEYYQRPEVKAKKKEYYKKPEVKEKAREYYKKQKEMRDGNRH